MRIELYSDWSGLDIKDKMISSIFISFERDNMSSPVKTPNSLLPLTNFSPLQHSTPDIMSVPNAPRRRHQSFRQRQLNVRKLILPDESSEGEPTIRKIIPEDFMDETSVYENVKSCVEKGQLPYQRHLLMVREKYLQMTPNDVITSSDVTFLRWLSEKFSPSSQPKSEEELGYVEGMLTLINKRLSDLELVSSTQ